MITTPGISDPAAEWNETLTRLLAGGAVLLFAFLFFTLVGHHERAVYLGAGPAYAQGVILQTDPPARYIIPNDARLDALRPSCRYDFKYAGGGKGEQKNRYVRAVTLIGCPAGGSVA
jgi:hypothetical protein